MKTNIFVVAKSKESIKESDYFNCVYTKTGKQSFQHYFNKKPMIFSCEKENELENERKKSISGTKYDFRTSLFRKSSESTCDKKNEFNSVLINSLKISNKYQQLNTSIKTQDCLDTDLKIFPLKYEVVNKVPENILHECSHFLGKKEN